MVSYSFGGKAKPVGYLSTTVKGRNWSTMHVSDVRRLRGGEVFDQPVFGADAALVPDSQRIDAARKLMYRAFAAAQRRAMDVYFAVDVNTASANPQELVETLPPRGPLPAGPAGQTACGWLIRTRRKAISSTRRKSVVAGRLSADHVLVAWFRPSGTPWMEISVAQMPPAWQKEFAAELARRAEDAKLWRAPQMFAIGKIVCALRPGH